MIELRDDNPVVLRATKVPGELIIGDEKPIRSMCGAVFSESHYGFSFTTVSDNKFFYPTQCQIFGVEIEKGYLKVFEDGKFIPWRIDVNTGEVKECAKFLRVSRRDMRYLEEKFGLGPDDLDRVNSYLEDINRLKKNQ